MSQERLSMRKIREILRLKSECQLSRLPHLAQHGERVCQASRSGCSTHREAARAVMMIRPSRLIERLVLFIVNWEH